MSEVVTSYYNGNEPYRRFTNFFNSRCKGDESTLRELAHSVLTGSIPFGPIRFELLRRSTECGSKTTSVEREATADAFTDVIMSYVNIGK